MQMISAAEQNLIETMVDLGAPDDLIHVMCSALTEEQQTAATGLLKEHNLKHGKVSEEDMLKALLMLTREGRVEVTNGKDMEANSGRDG